MNRTTAPRIDAAELQRLILSLASIGDEIGRAIEDANSFAVETSNFFHAALADAVIRRLRIISTRHH